MHQDFDHNPATSRPDKPWFLKWRWWLIVLSVIAAMGWGIWQFSNKPENNAANAAAPKDSHEQRPVAVAVATASQGDLPVFLHGLGTVTPLRTVTVRSRVDGELVRVAFKESQLVQQGDVLVEIDPRAFQVQLHQAEGQLLHDEALLKNAEIDLTRYQTLLKQDSIAAQQTVTQEALVKQYRGTVEVDKAQVENAKLQLSYTKITAPITGRLGLRLVDQGNLVHATDSNGLVVITQLQPITVVFTLPEDVVPPVLRRWHSGASLPIEAYDRTGSQKLAEGKLLAIDNVIDPTTGTFKLKAQFNNDDGLLFANQFVNIKMHLDSLHNATLVATAAIQQGAMGSFVYVVKEDQSVTVQPVKVGPSNADTTAVLDGLKAGQKVVVEGIDKLREGIKVKVLGQNNDPPPAEASPRPHNKQP